LPGGSWNFVCLFISRVPIFAVLRGFELSHSATFEVPRSSGMICIDCAPRSPASPRWGGDFLIFWPFPPFHHFADPFQLHFQNYKRIVPAPPNCKNTFPSPFHKRCGGDESFLLLSHSLFSFRTFPFFFCFFDEIFFVRFRFFLPSSPFFLGNFGFNFSSSCLVTPPKFSFPFFSLGASHSLLPPLEPPTNNPTILS